MENTVTDKQIYEDALLTELMRYVTLQRKDFNETEDFDLALKSVWYLQNPLNVPGREKIDITFPKLMTDEDDTYLARYRFTAHAHHNEPLVPSAEDLYIYYRYNLEQKYSCHIITDRFNLIEVENFK